MRPEIVALALIAMVSAGVWLSIRGPADAASRGLVVWVFAAVLLFGSGGAPDITFAGTMVITLVMAPRSPASRVAFFLVVAPCLPVGFFSLLSLPGIPFLTALTFYKIAVVVVLFPIVLRRETRARLSLNEVLLTSYAVATALAVAYNQTATNGLRFFTDQFIVLVLPYLAVRRASRNLDELNEVLNGFVVAAYILAGMAVMSALLKWDFYRFYEPSTIFAVPEYRFSFLRVAVTANYHSLGYYLAAAILIAEYLRRQSALQLRWPVFVYPPLLIGLLFTNSRGAMGGLVVALGAAWLFQIASIQRRIFVAVVAIAALYVGPDYFMSNDVASYDPYGTFKYRQDLIDTSIRFIIDRPWFGDFNFSSSPEFAPLLQGQGIVDITNLYLLLAIYYGLPTAALFFCAIGLALFRALFSKTLNVVDEKKGSPDLGVMPSRIQYSQPVVTTAAPTTFANSMVLVRAVLAGCLVGWLFLIVTTSDVGLTMHLGLVLAACSEASSRLGKQTIYGAYRFAGGVPLNKLKPGHLANSTTAGIVG